jgi:hypothetical protein
MEAQLMSVVRKYGVKVCLKHQFGADHAKAREYLKHKTSPADIVTLIDGKCTWLQISHRLKSGSIRGKSLMTFW